MFFTLLVCDLRADTGCSGHGAGSAPPLEATSWTSFMTRTQPWTTSWVCTRRRLATSGAPPTSPNIPTSSTHWRSTMDRFEQTCENREANIPQQVYYCVLPTFICGVTGQDEEAVKRLTASAGTKSKLAKPVQELIKMIFDVESMKKAMVEFEVRPSDV